jgi:hypothetical protein
MNASEIKADLHFLIEHINDESILYAIRNILSKQTKERKDWAIDLSEELRAELEKSLIEANKGKFIKHEDAMNQIKSRYHL